MAKFSENFEENILKNVHESAEMVKEKLHSDLVNMANGQVLKDMKKQKNMASVASTSNVSASNANNANNANSKTRVREMNNAPRVIPSNLAPVSPQQNQTTSDKYKYVSNGEIPATGEQNNPFASLREGGNASASTILIVIASFVIVAMLIVICLTVLSTFGMLHLK